MPGLGRALVLRVAALAARAGRPMSARDPETAFALGYADGLHGRPLTYVDDALVDHYADGRRAGTARSGRLSSPRAPYFDTPYCRAVLARPLDTPEVP